jgi:hypothetical protein
MPAANSKESPPPSPYPGQRALPTKVESDLRLACAGVLLNTKPSHQYVAPDTTSTATKQALDYDAIKRSASTLKSQASRPFPPRTDSADEKHPLKYAYRPDAPIDQLFSKTDPTADPVHSILGKSKYDTPMGSRAKTPDPNALLSPSSDVGTRPHVAKRSLSGGTNGSTPITDATEYHWSTSTAPTSAAITPARNSKRESSHIPVEQDSAVKTDASAIEWMRNELERRRQRQAAEEEQAALPPLSRAPSRSRSIRSIRSLRDNIKEYIRPSSSGNSRPPSRSTSRSSLRSDSQSQDPDIRGGWRSWGKTLKKEHAQTDVSRSNSSRGRKDSPKVSNSKKSEINLNRELPPLPGLDQWRDEPSAPPARAAPKPPPLTHHPVHREHSRNTKSVDSVMGEKDEIIAARLGSPVKEKPDVYMPSRSPRYTAATKMPNPGAVHTNDNLLPRSKSAAHARTPEPASSSIRAISSHHQGGSSSTSSRVRSPSNPAFSSPSAGFSQHRNYDSSSIPTPLGSISSSSLNKKPSERSTTTASSSKQTRQQAKDVLVQIRSPPAVPPKQTSDKKAWWNIKAKTKKPATWMDQLEKMGGVKDGVLIAEDADNACGAPHIRY